LKISSDFFEGLSSSSYLISMAFSSPKAGLTFGDSSFSVSSSWGLSSLLVRLLEASPLSKYDCFYLLTSCWWTLHLFC